MPKTKADLERLAKSAGATLEEDEGWRDMRTFQLVAPDGKRWTEGVLCFRVEWARGATPSAAKHNEDAYRDAAERIKCGLEAIPAEDADLYAAD